jgi:hypothetical protein
LLVIRGQMRKLFNSQELEPGDKVLTLSRAG